MSGVRWAEFARSIGDRVCIVRDRRTVQGKVERVGRLGFVVELDDGTIAWRMSHEVYDIDDTEVTP